MARAVLVLLLLCHWPLAYSWLPEPAPEPVISLGSNVCPEALDLIVRFEIVSSGYYQRHLSTPIWPGGSSGATIGVGYDLGHQVPPVIREDWRDHPQIDVLPKAAGVVGRSAKQLTAGMAYVVTPFDLAETVFTQSTLTRYWLMTKRAYPGVEEMPGCVGGALLSLTYNRGGGMAGDRGREKRAIRYICIPNRDAKCVADQIIAMKRIWAGTRLEKGLGRRRDAEARVIWSL